MTSIERVIHKATMDRLRLQSIRASYNGLSVPEKIEARSEICILEDRISNYEKWLRQCGRELRDPIAGGRS